MEMDSVHNIAIDSAPNRMAHIARMGSWWSKLDPRHYIIRGITAGLGVMHHGVRIVVLKNVTDWSDA